MSMLSLFVAFVMALAAPASAHAAPDRVTESVGGVDVALPVPAGYVVARGSDLIAMAELLTPMPMRLVALFIDERDMRLRDTGQAMQMQRYFMVQTVRQFEALTLGDAEIASLKANVRQQSPSVFDEGANSIGVLTGTKSPDGMTGSALTTVVVRGKVLYFNANSRLQSDVDLEWLRAQSRDWLTRINAANAR
jgi:uncharacterized protein (DUF4415 family)